MQGFFNLQNKGTAYKLKSTLFIISSACFTSSNNVSPAAVLKTGTRAGSVDCSKSFLS